MDAIQICYQFIIKVRLANLAVLLMLPKIVIKIKRKTVTNQDISVLRAGSKILPAVRKAHVQHLVLVVSQHFRLNNRNLVAQPDEFLVPRFTYKNNPQIEVWNEIVLLVCTCREADGPVDLEVADQQILPEEVVLAGVVPVHAGAARVHEVLVVQVSEQGEESRRRQVLPHVCSLFLQLIPRSRVSSYRDCNSESVTRNCAVSPLKIHFSGYFYSIRVDSTAFLIRYYCYR